jgi:Xaa-Pro dipeptidase
VAAAMIAAAYHHGSEYVGLEPFVCAGTRSGTKHATWRRKELRSGDLVTLENSACVNRYHAALFRTACVAGKANDRARKMRDACIEGLDAALANLRPGRTCADVHRAVQSVVDRHGYTDNFRKRSGYSMGIAFPPDWGEGNVLSLYDGVDVPLAPGMVFHMPISLCEYGQFTVAASETAIVGEGPPRTLSTVTRALF